MLLAGVPCEVAELGEGHAACLAHVLPNAGMHARVQVAAQVRSAGKALVARQTPWCRAVVRPPVRAEGILAFVDSVAVGTRE
tara:strand:+ start:1813 stop:2058 length:246 start_codon:yes stop_codon:yes gene_type:complete